MNTFDFGKVRDPQYFCDRRLEAHSDHKFYSSVMDMETGYESFKESLNGLSLHDALPIWLRLRASRRKSTPA